MRSLAEIEAELERTRNELAEVAGSPTEVYSRIVGYYRSVRNWNRGKREEFGERKLFRIDANFSPSQALRPVPTKTRTAEPESSSGTPSRVILFTRASCPACPAAKEAALRLPIHVEVLDADTEAGLREAQRHGVYSTPTAILLDADSTELARAGDARAIAALPIGSALAEVASL